MHYYSYCILCFFGGQYILVDYRLIYQIFEAEDDWYRTSYNNWATQPQSQEPSIHLPIQDGEEVFFKIKSTTQLKKLMDAYCQRQSVFISKQSLTPPTFDSSLMDRGLMKTRPPKTSTWKMAMRSMSWFSKSEVHSENDVKPYYLLNNSFMHYHSSDTS